MTKDLSDDIEPWSAHDVFAYRIYDWLAVETATFIRASSLPRGTTDAGARNHADKMVSAFADLNKTLDFRDDLFDKKELFLLVAGACDALVAIDESAHYVDQRITDRKHVVDGLRYAVADGSWTNAREAFIGESDWVDSLLESRSSPTFYGYMKLEDTGLTTRFNELTGRKGAASPINELRLALGRDTSETPRFVILESWPFGTGKGTNSTHPAVTMREPRTHQPVVLLQAETATFILDAFSEGSTIASPSPALKEAMSFMRHEGVHALINLATSHNVGRIFDESLAESLSGDSERSYRTLKMFLRTAGAIAGVDIRKMVVDAINAPSPKLALYESLVGALGLRRAFELARVQPDLEHVKLPPGHHPYRSFLMSLTAEQMLRRTSAVVKADVEVFADSIRIELGGDADKTALWNLRFSEILPPMIVELVQSPAIDPPSTPLEL